MTILTVFAMDTRKVSIADAAIRLIARIHYRVTFTGYIRCFCATTSHDLVTLTFDLLTLRVFRVQCFSCLTHVPIFIILRLSVTELRLLNIWSHFRYLKQSLRKRRVTWPLTGGKNSLHFWNPWPQFAYSLCHFKGATTKIKPCYRQKNCVFPLWRLQSLLRMRSITWPVHRRSPKTTRNNFLSQNCPFTILLLCGYDDDQG